MKIAIIGSSQYQEKVRKKADELRSQGHDVRLPAYDDYKDFDELDCISYNRALIEWADEVHIIWDNRSSGTIFDFGMCFALRKKVVVDYIESKTFEKAMKAYASFCRSESLKS